MLNEWLETPVAVFPAWAGLPFPISDAALAHQAQARTAIAALNLDWNGERVFQAARFGTEMQYNRIVFDEFAPTCTVLGPTCWNSRVRGADIEQAVHQAVLESQVLIQTRILI